jgi:hypothetical protein
MDGTLDFANFNWGKILNSNNANTQIHSIFVKLLENTFLGCVWAAQWPTSSELKINFDPSLDRSWCEFFKIIKNHGPKNPPPGCNLGGLFPPVEIFSKKIRVFCPSI